MAELRECQTGGDKLLTLLDDDPSRCFSLRTPASLFAEIWFPLSVFFHASFLEVVSFWTSSLQILLLYILQSITQLCARLLKYYIAHNRTWPVFIPQICCNTTLSIPGKLHRISEPKYNGTCTLLCFSVPLLWQAAHVGLTWIRYPGFCPTRQLTPWTYRLPIQVHIGASLYLALVTRPY